MSVLRRGYLASAILACCIGTVSPAMAAGDKPDAINDAWIKAVTSADLEGVMKLYADDAIAWFPEEPEHKGATAIRASYKNLFDTYKIDAASLTNRQYEGDGKHVAHWGNYSLTVTQKSDGKTMTWTGRYTDITELRKGHWVYVADHASGDPPPPKPATAPK